MERGGEGGRVRDREGEKTRGGERERGREREGEREGESEREQTLRALGYGRDAQRRVPAFDK